MRNFIYLACLLCMGSLFAACSGSECSATSDFIDDIDSDCAEDSADNCVGTYNPDQFDGDDDGIGYACDADDTVEGSVSALLMVESEFNIAGYYEFENVCGNFTTLKIEQSLNTITATDDSENIFEGSVDSENTTAAGSLTNDNLKCDFSYDSASNVMNMNCDCSFTGTKLFTHLKTE